MIIERFVMSYITHEPQDTGVPEPIRLKGHGGELVTLKGAIDLHLHTYPDLFPRLVDDIELPSSPPSPKCGRWPSSPTSRAPYHGRTSRSRWSQKSRSSVELY